MPSAWARPRSRVRHGRHRARARRPRRARRCGRSVRGDAARGARQTRRRSLGHSLDRAIRRVVSTITRVCIRRRRRELPLDGLAGGVPDAPPRADAGRLPRACDGEVVRASAVGCRDRTARRAVFDEPRVSSARSRARAYRTRIVRGSGAALDAGIAVRAIDRRLRRVVAHAKRAVARAHAARRRRGLRSRRPGRARGARLYRRDSRKRRGDSCRGGCRQYLERYSTPGLRGSGLRSSAGSGVCL